VNGERSLLFVPATSERKIDRAFASAADGVIVDLEDAVAVAEKPAARRALAAILAVPRRLPVYVRVNATGTPFCYQDLLAATAAGVAGVVLPKAESAEEMRTIDWLMLQLEAERGLAPRSCALMPIVETARGLAAADAIAGATPRIRRLAFGAVDLALDLSIDLDDDAGATAQARFAIARASRVAGIEAPLDTAFVDFRDGAGLRATAERARALGFAGKACIHPDQIDIVNAVFTPGPQEIERAARIVAAFERAEAAGAAAVALDGQMIDYPVVEKARRVLKRWPEAAAAVRRDREE
jgi:citrate lyase subunit beta/citryl-CoA lyase